METYCTDIKHRVLSRAIPQESGCIEYREGKLKHRYGLISITIEGKRKSVPVHRALWMAVNNRLDLPSNIFIRHKCDNPCCVNIDHLEHGTAKDNMQDCVERDRRAKSHRPHTRERIHNNELVESIRNAEGKLKWIANEYSVSIGYVSKIKNNKLKRQ